MKLTNNMNYLEYLKWIMEQTTNNLHLQVCSQTMEKNTTFRQPENKGAIKTKYYQNTFKVLLYSSTITWSIWFPRFL